MNKIDNKLVDLNHPDYHIQLSQFDNPCEIKEFFRDIIGRTPHAYQILFRDRTIKFGESGESGRDVGERIYRQIANIPGWSTIPKGGAGKDILETLKDFEKEYCATILREECSINIWTGFHIAGDNNRSISTFLEQSLLDQYEEIHGEYPIGNRKKAQKQKAVVTVSQFDKFFYTK